MSQITDFLARVGSDARLRHADSGDMQASLAALNLDAAVRTAIIDGDTKQLERLAGVKSNTCCLIELVEDVVDSAG